MILLSALSLVWTMVGAQETIVFSGYPVSKVESGIEATTRSEMTGAQSSEYRVLIVKRGTKYYWASREDRELMHFQSGIAHWFISESSGYIKIIDPSLMLGNAGADQYVYIEHMTLLVDTITYWGSGTELSP